MRYSQNKEEEIVKKYFGDFTGTLLSIGENDGETLSNSRALILSGWTATLVEPSPKAFKKLFCLYKGNPGICLLNYAIGSIDGECIFFDSGTHLEKGDVALLSTAIRNEIKRFPSTSFTEIKVRMKSFETMLNDTEHKIFDFVSIDAEGMDLEILQQIDLKALAVKCVCIEWNSMPKMFNEINRIMVTDRFQLIHQNAENLIYAV